MKQEQNSFSRLWTYLRAYRLEVCLSIFLKILSVIMSVVEPFVLGLAITELTKNLMDMAKGLAGASLNTSYIAIIMTLYLFRGVLYELGSYYSNYFMTNAVQKTVQDMRNDLSHKINHIPVSYFDRHQFGDLLGRFTSDVETVSNALQQSFLQIVNAIFTLRFVQENLTGFNVLKLYVREKSSQEEFHDITHHLQKVGFKANFISGLMMPILNGISDLTYLMIALMGGLQVLAGRLTVGNMQAFVQYVWQINQPIQNLTQLAGQLQSAKSSLDRIFQVMDEPDEVADVTETLSGDLTGQVSFKHVDFQYVADKPLIRDFNLEVKPGEMVAIVGPTGAGKTTLINLLMRFYDVTAGSITVDGHDIRHLSRQDYRKQFGMVLQDAWLYEGTIKENLRFGNLEATDEEIVEAAKAANVDHFIRTLPGGYNMEMNQESSNISLGQKQLLTIARALLADPKILILDEATSSVDTRLELLIQKAMKNLMKGRTSFVIAHRLSTIQEADKILVLKDGQIIEQGNHQSLLADKGFYYELYNSQFSSKQAN